MHVHGEYCFESSTAPREGKYNALEILLFLLVVQVGFENYKAVDASFEALARGGVRQGERPRCGTSVSFRRPFLLPPRGNYRENKRRGRCRCCAGSQ